MRTAQVFSMLLVAALGAASFGAGGCGMSSLDKGFCQPPASVRPWTYWFWLNGNITKEGITADLEAMKRVGIGGVLIMEVDQGAPLGPVAFASPEWRELFKHVVAEASRLGLEVNMNNDAGWCGSGGPWITPALAMQKVVWTETAVRGPSRFDAALPQPKAVADYYRDVAALAFPTPAADDGKTAALSAWAKSLPAKAGFAKQEVPLQAAYPVVPAKLTVSRDRIVDLTSRLGKDGRLAWDVPEGEWTILRIGHTPTGVNNSPAPLSGRGLECDKLSKEGIEAQFAGLMAKLVADVGPLAGKTLVSTHIDSWEVGSQNWTPRFREEFQRLRGYDPLRFLPVMTGRIVDSLEVSERFLWDLRQTVSDLLVDNYAGHMRDLANKHGLRLSIEAYGGVPCGEMTYAGRADEPMGEFWTWNPYGAAESCTEMTSAAHVYGKRIVGAEAFTAGKGERWLGHPFLVKVFGDWAFCEGINRLVFHRYPLQPWLDRKPGMAMGQWGLHYERTQTWWEQSTAWHEYLARCQFLLQQGLFVADICCLEPERSPQSFQRPKSLPGDALDRPRYNFDGCPPEVVLTRMAVKDGRLTLPDGMSYRLLVLPETETMTPRLLGKIKELVEAGATVVGPRPLKSPSLADYPKCDEEVQKLAADLWGDCDGKAVKEHPYGKGKVVWGKAPDEILAGMGVKPDFTSRGKASEQVLRYIHRTIGEADVYFVANKTQQAAEAVCSFRVQGKRPELWRPDTGRIEPVAVYDEADGCVRVPIRFGPSGSVFVVFRSPGPAEPDRITSVVLNSEVILDTALKDAGNQVVDNNSGVTNTFTMAVWVKPAADIALPREANAGKSGLTADRNDALYPPPGHEVYPDRSHAGAGISVGRNGVVVYEHSGGYFAPLLVWGAPLTEWTHLAVAYKDGEPSLYLNGKLVHKGLKSRLVVHPGVGVQHDRSVDDFRGELGAFQQINRALTEAEARQLMDSMARGSVHRQTAPVDIVRAAGGGYEATVSQPGTYVLKSADGKTRRFEVSSVPAPVEITGPWELRFPPKWGAPERVTLDKLISWSEHADSGVKYFSGTAVYSRKVNVPPEMVGKARRLYLDLGKVEVIAQVRINGKDLGILWKPPFSADITDAVKAGENSLEVKVTNLWPNRMIGDEELPEDSDRTPKGTLKEWPKWLLEGKPSPTGRYTFTTWRLWPKGSPLLPSGLLGPVTLRAAETVTVQGP